MYYVFTPRGETSASERGKKKELKRKKYSKQSWFHRTANAAAASPVKFIFNAHHKSSGCFPPPYLPHTAFNYFAYYCVLSDKNKAELIIHPEMRTLNCSLQGPLRGLCIYYKMQTEERRKGTEVSQSPEKAEFSINSFK